MRLVCTSFNSRGHSFLLPPQHREKHMHTRRESFTHALMLTSSQCLFAGSRASRWTPAAIETDSDVVSLPLLSLAVAGFDACVHHVRAPRPQTSADYKQGRWSLGCCGLCHSRAATTTESHTGFLSAGDKPGSGVSARPGPEGTGLLYALVS